MGYLSEITHVSTGAVAKLLELSLKDEPNSKPGTADTNNGNNEILITDSAAGAATTSSSRPMSM